MQFVFQFQSSLFVLWRTISGKQLKSNIPKDKYYTHVIHTVKKKWWLKFKTNTKGLLTTPAWHKKVPEFMSHQAAHKL